MVSTTLLTMTTQHTGPLSGGGSVKVKAMILPFLFLPMTVLLCIPIWSNESRKYIYRWYRELHNFSSKCAWFEPPGFPPNHRDILALYLQCCWVPWSWPFPIGNQGGRPDVARQMRLKHHQSKPAGLGLSLRKGRFRHSSDWNSDDPCSENKNVWTKKSETEHLYFLPECIT